MSDDNQLSQRKYYRLIDLARRWDVEACELLRLALEYGIGVAILEYRGADHHIADAADDEEFPNWAVFVASDVLKKFASVGGDAYVAGGCRFAKSEAIPVFFPERRITPEDLIVLPEAYVELVKIVDGGTKGAVQPEPEMTPASRSTLLKQIAMLAILLSKQQKKFAWGARPNGSAIAREIGIDIANWPVNAASKLKKDFFSESKINESIKEGLELIGFEKSEEK